MCQAKISLNELIKLRNNNKISETNLSKQISKVAILKQYQFLCKTAEAFFFYIEITANTANFIVT